MLFTGKCQKYILVYRYEVTKNSERFRTFIFLLEAVKAGEVVVDCV